MIGTPAGFPLSTYPIFSTGVSIDFSAATPAFCRQASFNPAIPAAWINCRRVVFITVKLWPLHHRLQSLRSMEVPMTRTGIATTLLLFVLTASAQGNLGTITGTIKGPDGSAVTGATLQAKNVMSG